MSTILERRSVDRDDSLKILIVDDNAIDAELSLMALRRGGVAADYRIAGNEAELRATLDVFVPDVILCDFSFPDLDGRTAQRIVHEAYADIPIILVSGAISEDLAISAVRSGAVDYVLKSNLIRLPIVVKRAVQDARESRRRAVSLRDSQERARHHAERLETLWRIANNPALRGEALLLEMLQQATRDIRPDQHFRGVLGRFEQDDIVIIALSQAQDDDASAFELQIGSRTPIQNTLFPRSGRPQSCDDLRTLPGAKVRSLRLGWGSAITTQFEAAGSRYSLTFASPQPTKTPFGPDDGIYLDVLGMSFANQMVVRQLERSLRSEEERSRQHAQRLEDLWKIVNNSELRDEDLWHAMLDQAAVSIWPGTRARGTLWRIDGGLLKLEAVTDSTGTKLATSHVGVGGSIELASSVVEQIVSAGGGTKFWDDLQGSADATAYSHVHNVRALAVTTFVAGGTTWALAFASGYVASQPLGSHERAYIEVLASFFSNHVQQRWQFDRIQYHQSHDVLTGLLNRSQFRSQARAVARSSTRFAIILVNVDAFREINESYGHLIGDALLVEVGQALQQSSRDGEIVGRIVGDVFAIFVPEPVSKEFVRERARDFAAVFAQPFSTGDRDGKEFIVRTASLGVAIAPEDGVMIDTIHSHAEAALVAAKASGHGSTVFYAAGMEGDAQRRATLRNELSLAVAADQFELYYQPHVDLRTGEVSGCEALIRWHHPERGLVLPGAFIPFAEQVGIIPSIDSWVMQHAFAAANELGVLRPGFRLYFNLSGRQAGDPTVIRAFTAAARAGVALGNVGVEITETDAMRDIEATRHVCRALRRLNVRIAIDDFGTGYSSLSSLKRLPVDIVKIDRSFISGILDDPHDETIADTIITIAERFGFESLAEGVERREEIDWLRRRPCGYMQGFAICHPLPLEAFKSWLAAREG